MAERLPMPPDGSQPPLNPPHSRPDPKGRRPRILFVSEAVTLAHLARPIILAKALEPDRYDVSLAVAPRFQSLWDNLPWKVRPIQSISTEQFLNALDRGRPLYDAETLRRYVHEDLEVIQEMMPDAIVGDFRLSLSASARLAGIPYLTVTNAYWSPFARQRFPMPELRPLTHRLPLTAARAVFHLARPFVFASHASALNRVRREHGLPGLGPDLRMTYTDADHVLYADLPEFAPTVEPPPSHHYLGPIHWSPSIDPPHWWPELRDDQPIIYVNLGSSGRSELLADVLNGLANLPVSVIAASPRASWPARIPENARLAPYLSGSEACCRASLVICNGGSPTVYQALSASVPVIGLARNMDQHLNMQSVQRLQVGLLLRSDRTTPAALRAAAVSVLSDTQYQKRASEIAQMISNYDTSTNFKKVLDQIVCGQKA